LLWRALLETLQPVFCPFFRAEGARRADVLPLHDRLIAPRFCQRS
jgi:hypothetical protein